MNVITHTHTHTNLQRTRGNGSIHHAVSTGMTRDRELFFWHQTRKSTYESNNINLSIIKVFPPKHNHEIL